MGNSNSTSNSQVVVDPQQIQADDYYNSKIICKIFKTNYSLYSLSSNNPIITEFNFVNDELKSIPHNHNNQLEQLLPEEMIIHILEYLPPEYLIQIRRVSKSFNEYWSNLPQLWQALQLKNQRKHYLMPFAPDVLCLQNSSRSNYVLNQLYFERAFKPTLINSFTVLNRRSKKELESIGATTNHNVILSGRKSCEIRALILKVATNCLALFPEEGQLYYQHKSSENMYSMSLYEHLIYDQDIPHYPYKLYQKEKETIACFCFNVNDISSFEAAKECFVRWTVSNYIDNIVEHLERNNGCVLFLGLRCELEEKVSDKDVCQFIKENFAISNNSSCPIIGQLHTNRVQYFKLSEKKDSQNNLLFPFLFAKSVLNLNPIDNPHEFENQT